MFDLWSLISKPEFWFVNIVVALLVNIASHGLVQYFPRWLAAIGDWHKVTKAILLIYSATIVVAVINISGDPIFSDAGDGFLYRVLHVFSHYGVAAVLPPMLLHTYRVGPVADVTYLTAVCGVLLLTAYAHASIPEPAPFLFYFFFLNILLTTIFMVCFVVGAIVWQVRNGPSHS